MAAGMVRDAVRGFTWQKLLLVQLLALAIELVAILSFVLPFQAPPTFPLARLVVEETIAFSIVLALLAGQQLTRRGVPPFAAYATAIVAASLLAAVTQFEVRHWLGVYTNADQPGVALPRRRMQMVYVASDTLTYGALFLLIYLDYERRERLLRRMREVELARARHQQHAAHAQFEAVRSGIDAEALMAELNEVRQLLEANAPEAERRLDGLVAGLRGTVGRVEPAYIVSVARQSQSAIVPEDV